MIKAAMSAPTGDLATCFGKAHARPAHLQQGVSERLRKQLASAGIAIKGPTTAARNGAEASSVEAIRQIHSGGARKISPISLPPESDNSAKAPTRIHPHITAPAGDQYRTPEYSPPPLFGAAPQSASESSPALPPGDNDQYGFTNALKAIAEIHRRGPRAMWES